MKLLWKNSFEGLELTRTSPLYYGSAVQRDNQVLNWYSFVSYLGITEVSFNVHNGQILSWGTDGNTEEYKEKYKRKHAPYHFEYDDFVFGEYTISHCGEWGYTCRKNENFLWKKALKGYLYTDMIRNQNNIVFGTSGQGGHFYSLNIDTGEIVFDYNTKGTSKFYDVNNSFYFCLRDGKNTQILRIDYSGNVLENIEVEGTYYDGDCLFAICEDILCIMTLKKKSNRELFLPILYCIQL